MEFISPQMYVGLKFKPKYNHLAHIMNVVCHSLKLNKKEVMGKTRFEHLVRARQIYCYVARQNGFTFDVIGKYIKRDHATVIYGCKLVKNRQFDFKMLDDFNKVIENL